MPYPVVLSDALYHQLRAKTQQLGFASVEQLLDSPLLLMVFDHPMFDLVAPNALRDLYQHIEEAFLQRKSAIEKIDELHERLLAQYGEMPDSTPTIRASRGSRKPLPPQKS